MAQNFSSEQLKLLKDPYAVLGLSVSADEQRISRRYRRIAMLLHPDRYVASEQSNGKLAQDLLAKLVNPAHDGIRQEANRKEILARLRLQARQQQKEASSEPQSDLVQKLLQQPPTEIDVFYEQAIVQLADTQYNPLTNFDLITQQLGALNLVYLHLKSGNPFLREQRTGMVPVAETSPQRSSIFPHDPSASTIDYARRHYERAREYAGRELWRDMVKELQDALKIDSKKSEYHSLLGYAYFRQKLPGMAKVSFRTALILNPQDLVASRFASQVGLEVPGQSSPSRKAPSVVSKNGATPKNGAVPHQTSHNHVKPSERAPHSSSKQSATKSIQPFPKSVMIGAAITGVILVVLSFVIWKYGQASRSTKPTSWSPVNSRIHLTTFHLTEIDHSDSDR